jgi:hypothetical protein
MTIHRETLPSHPGRSAILNLVIELLDLDEVCIIIFVLKNAIQEENQVLAFY